VLEGSRGKRKDVEVKESQRSKGIKKRHSRSSTPRSPQYDVFEEIRQINKVF